MSSSLPPHNNNNIEGNEQLISPIDECWSTLYQEILGAGDEADENVIMNELSNFNLISNVDHMRHELVLENNNNNGLEETMGSPSPSPNSSSMPKKKLNKKAAVIINEAGPSVAKKLDHNAKERIRRMKINASFLALRALLPNSTRSKKRWGAPAVVDKVVKYIPEMEKEVHALRCKKETLQSTNSKHEEIPTFSFNKVNEEEAVIQICMRKQDYEQGLAFMRLLQRVEDEGILINSVSAIHICNDTIICCHLHIQISDATFGVDYIEQLRDKIISWLR